MEYLLICISTVVLYVSLPLKNVRSGGHHVWRAGKSASGRTSTRHDFRGPDSLANQTACVHFSHPFIN
jgi:hypothetical protein